MLDSGTKPLENRIHLFDPVGLINDGYGGTYRSSNYASRPRRPTKSYSNFEEVNTNNNNNNNINEGLKSYDSFNTNVIEPNGVVGGGIRSYDSFTDGVNNTGLRSYNSFSMEANVGAKKDDLDYTTTNNSININTINSNNDSDDRNNNHGVEIRFGVVSNNNVEDDNDDVCTPRLWKSNSPSTTSSPRSMNTSSYFNGSISPLNTNNNIPRGSLSLSSSPVHPNDKSKHMNQQQQQQQQQSVSQSSRTQAIAKGRKELMDMVRDLPESFYELSLKDIVDKKAEFGVQKGGGEMIPEEKKSVGNKEIASSNKTTMETKKGKKSGNNKKVKKSESKKKMVKSRSSVDNGRFRLRNSVFPIFSGSRKNKKRLMGSNSFQIAPMPKQNPSSDGSMKAVDQKDWWKRKSCMSSESEDNKSASSSSSINSSSRSSSINERRSSRFLPTCCLFNGRRIRSKK
ncbi:hypothetical protein vseg_017533 [Gypsophila vaccaria]